MHAIPNSVQDNDDNPTVVECASDAIDVATGINGLVNSFSVDIVDDVICDSDEARNCGSENDLITECPLDTCIFVSDDDFLPYFSDDDDYDKNVGVESQSCTLVEELSQWMVEARVTRKDGNSLLSVLRRHGLDLPKDSCTLLKMPRRISFEKKCGGSYIYIGINPLLQSVLEYCLCDCLSLQCNIDGIPLFKSSGSQFWPILVSVNRLPPAV